jgi:hypothetical protein
VRHAATKIDAGDMRAPPSTTAHKGQEILQVSQRSILRDLTYYQNGKQAI